MGIRPENYLLAGDGNGKIEKGKAHFTYISF